MKSFTHPPENVFHPLSRGMSVDPDVVNFALLPILLSRAPRSSAPLWLVGRENEDWLVLMPHAERDGRSPGTLGVPCLRRLQYRSGAWFHGPLGSNTGDDGYSPGTQTPLAVPFDPKNIPGLYAGALLAADETLARNLLHVQELLRVFAWCPAFPGLLSLQPICRDLGRALDSERSPFVSACTLADRLADAADVLTYLRAEPGTIPTFSATPWPAAAQVSQLAQALLGIGRFSVRYVGLSEDQVAQTTALLRSQFSVAPGETARPIFDFARSDFHTPKFPLNMEDRFLPDERGWDEPQRLFVNLKRALPMT